MKQPIIYTISIALFLCNVAYAQIKPFECVLIGTVLDRPQSTELLLTKDGDDLRIKSTSIPIVDGKFQHTFTAEHIEGYKLSFADEFSNGVWRPFVFFSEQDTLYITLHPMDNFFDNRITGGYWNQKQMAYHDEAERLFGLGGMENRIKVLKQEDKYYTPEAKLLRAEIEKATTDTQRDSLVQLAMQLDSEKKHLMPEAKQLETAIDSNTLDLFEWRANQVMTHPDLVNYQYLIQFYQMLTERPDAPISATIPDLLGVYEQHYKPQYPDHPYTTKMETYVIVSNTIKEGGKYVDFTAPDFEGREVALSEKINGKYALINLWASWCGPCRRKGIDMIPVYEAFRDRGFEIVGVARERNPQHGIHAARMDKYPWLNLLEIGDKGGIWEKYGIVNAGGATFLVDPEGKILAVSPTAEEVSTILAERLR